MWALAREIDANVQRVWEFLATRTFDHARTMCVGYKFACIEQADEFRNWATAMFPNYHFWTYDCPEAPEWDTVWCIDKHYADSSEF